MQQLKTENQIYADIIGFINNALSELNVADWQVLQLKQPVKLTEIMPTIYVTIANKNRIGWQKRTYPIVNDDLKIKEQFKLNLDVQISALKRRSLSDTVSTINAGDILELLKAYLLNPNNLVKLKKTGYLIFQPSSINNNDFIDDSDNFEYMPFFNVSFILEQTLISSQAAIDEHTLTIERL